MSDTFVNYITRCRRYLHEYNTNTSWWKDPVLKQYFNMNYRRYCNELVMAHEGYFTNTVTTPVIANQSYYTWPAGFERLTKLEVVYPDGKTLPLKRNERHEYVNYPSVSTQGYYPTFRPTGGGFFLEPACKDGATATTLLKSFDAVDPSIAELSGTAVTTTTFNIQEGSASYVIDKIGSSSVNFGFRESLDANLSNYIDGSIYIYVPTLNLNTEAYILSVTLDLGTSVNYNRWIWNTTGISASGILNIGWNRLNIDFTNPVSVGGTGWNQSAVDEIALTFTTGLTSIKPGGLLVDKFEVPYATIPSNTNYLKIEYYGTPELLEFDTDTLHPDFPVSFDELLVVSTVVTAMRAESMLENGPPRALSEELLKMEEQWLRYIDNRVVAKQRIQPFVGPYENA